MKTSASRKAKWIVTFWLLVSAGIYLAWPEEDRESGFAEVVILSVSIYLGMKFLRLMLQRPTKDQNVVIASITSLCGAISAFGIWGVITTLSGGTLGAAAASAVLGFWIGGCMRITEFLLPTKPFQKWGD